tara:strand:- start:1401 stop:1982 length:582 start_codon:yes stop_codon:yes gene_type:complete
MLATFHGQNEKQATILSNTSTSETLTLVQMPTTYPSDAPYHRTGIIVSTGTTLEATGHGSFDPWALAYISNWEMTANSGTHTFTFHPRHVNNYNIFIGITNYNSSSTDIVGLWNDSRVRAWQYSGRRPGIGSSSYTYSTSDTIKIEVNMDVQNPLISFYKNNFFRFSTSFNGGTTLYPYIAISGNRSATLTRN